MFQRALFPTDFSAYSTAVLKCLPEIKAAGLRDVVLLHVISPEQVPLGHGVDSDLLEKLRWTSQQKLDLMRMALEGHGLSARCRLEEGNPAVEIARIAREERVHLIVMGAQGLSLIQEFLLGSVAWEVVRHSRVPVLVEKFEVVKELGDVHCRKVCAESFKAVLHPTDFSECANSAFRIVKQLKSAGTEQVILLHVQDERAMKYRPQQQKDEFDREDMSRLEQMQKALTLNGLPSKAFVRTGIPFAEALKVAEEEDVSLIVLGTRGRSLIAELLSGSTFENVMRHSRRPVLAIPPPRPGDWA